MIKSQISFEEFEQVIVPLASKIGYMPEALPPAIQNDFISDLYAACQNPRHTWAAQSAMFGGWATQKSRQHALAAEERVMRENMKKLFVFLAAFYLSGCASTMRYAFDDSPMPCDKKGYIYGGVRLNSMFIKEGFSSEEEGSTFMACFGIIDFPFSLAMGTVLLPLAIPLELKNRSLCNEKKAEEDSTTHNKVF